MSVDWRYKYFEEPIIAFGATKEEIKARETHELIRERDNSISYEYPAEKMTIAVTYWFSESGLYETSTAVRDREKKMVWIDDILQQLQERYGNYSEVDGFKIFVSKKGGYRVSSYMLDLLYTPEEK